MLVVRFVLGVFNDHTFIIMKDIIITKSMCVPEYEQNMLYEIANMTRN